METGSITTYMDVAQVVLYAFWIFFAGLIYYLHRENKREGYPLESDLTELSGGRIVVEGFPPVPPPKSYRLHDGSIVQKPDHKVDTRLLRALPVAPWPGAPLQPTGNPMLDGVGPGAYAQRADVPDLTPEGEPKILPLRALSAFALDERDPDPRGMAVVAVDGGAAGEVCDVWIDQSELLIRYLEVRLPSSETEQRVLLPLNFARVDGRRRRVLVDAITAAQFSQVPALRQPDRITFLEEERIVAYFGGGKLYAWPGRVESLL
ncbi:MAG: photosynthetic reaction center subunit H [Gammaproteobacteria bacterium]|nr:photosynthetic reaction center subunit H [Gammaproteobacteria bacterium]